MEKLGPYKLEAVVGRGGMGTVYRAIDTESEQTLAVKVLSPAYCVDDHFRSRFESEIKALIKLDHPNIVRLVGYGQFEHNLYFAMELVEGQSLYQIQRNGKPFHWREVIRIAKNVALGLRHAHDRGIIHRDLKPGNLLKAYTGIIKITDFGIAKRFGQTQDTGTNVLGTVDFMSPEQAKGQPVTFRSDLYSLGTVMYTLLAGNPPFSGNSVEESMRNLTKVPAPRVIRQSPDVPQELDNLVAQLLEKDPEERIQTAMSLYHHLRQAEQKLLECSQAKTTERKISGASDKTSVISEPSTSVDEFRGSANTIRNNLTEDPSSPGPGRDGTTPELQTNTRTGIDLKKAEDGETDFFNTVTEDERQQHLEVEVDEDSQPALIGKLVLGFLFATVLSLGVFGIYYSNLPSTAESLYAEIKSSWDQPQKRMSEINEFLQHYPTHEKADSIRDRRDLALAFQKIHRLRGQSKGSKKLSNIESNFLSTVDTSKTDAPKALSQLDAFLTLYANNDSANDDSLAAEQAKDSRGSKDLECINAAKVYREQLRIVADKQIKNVRANIETQIKRAKTLPTDQAVAIYKSIMKLNGDFDWAADWITPAQEELDKLNLPN